MRLLICAGGTGGGVYPALAVLQKLTSNLEAMLWVGSQGGLEANLVQRAGIPYKEIPAAGVHGISLLQLPVNLIKLVKGFLASRKIISEFKPDGIFFTGGYLAIPLAFAAMNIPKLVYIPDIEPGLALKVLSRMASAIAVTVEDTRIYLPSNKKIYITGYPTREDLTDWTKTSACEWFGLDTEHPVILVFGGSRGARSINYAVREILNILLQNTQVIHICGKLDHEKMVEAYQSLPGHLQKKYLLYEYLHEMGAAFAAADFAISRAGASTLGEYPLVGLPAILIPYPYAWKYQKRNADYLVSKDAALMIPDEDIKEQLWSVISSLLDSPDQLLRMKQALKSLASPEASGKIAEMILEHSGKAIMPEEVRIDQP